jgi:predicted GH43/DUF377 family glycosyl hydrolase
MSSLPVTRHADVRIVRDPRRVIAKPFLPGEEILPDGSSRIALAVARVLALPEVAVVDTLRETEAGFTGRHRDLDGILEQNFAGVARRVAIPDDLSEPRRRLIGAYFTHEYAIEAAALTNPSMVAAPDQRGVASGCSRFVMSLRAIGEGHISCIEFRSGVIGPDLAITIEEPARFVMPGARTDVQHDRDFFIRKLTELGELDDVARSVLQRVGPQFTVEQLEDEMRACDRRGTGRTVHDRSVLHWLASSNYRTTFPLDSEMSERVIFPGGPTESRGMEDVRLVRFVRNDGSVVYYGTYTAFDGFRILPQLLETTDFVDFRVSTFAGLAAQNKGIAIFPRKVNDQYLALGRHDNMHNFLMTSDDVRVWHEFERIQEPKQPWEVIQLGNCGSPLETAAGWLVITHGVGPFRQYSLGALLLDLDDPVRVIGHLKEPLLTAAADERDGYVPNVVYSCGAMLHNGHVVVPYGYSDIGAGIATVPVAALLDRLVA